MWLILIALAAVMSTVLWYFSDKARERYNVGVLNLILWGTAIMFFVDHVVAYLAEGGPFLEVDLEAFLLSIVLLLTAFLAWCVVLFWKDPRGQFKAIVR